MQLLGTTLYAVVNHGDKLTLMGRDHFELSYRKIHGDVNNLLHSPITAAGETVFKGLATFYHITTRKGSVTLQL